MAKSSKNQFSQCRHCLGDFESTKVWVERVESSCGPAYLAGICESCAKENGVDTSTLETDLAFHKRVNQHMKR